MTRHGVRGAKESVLQPDIFQPEAPKRSLRFEVVESPSAGVRLNAARAFVEAVPAMSEALLVGASRGSVDDLARAVAVGVESKGVVVGLHRFSFTQLAARLAAPVLGRRRVVPATPIGTEAVAARAVFEARREQTLDYFKPVSSSPGFSRALARTLIELRLAGVGSSDLEPLAPVGADLAALFDEFDAQLAAASAGDRAPLFAAAVERLRTDRTPWSRLPLLLLDVPVWSRAERDLVRALLEASSSALATVPFGDVRTKDAFEAIGGTLSVVREPESGSDLAALRRYLFAGEGAQPPERTPAGDVVFFAAPGEGRETVEIARRILQEARRGVRFDEMAVLIRSPQAYAGLLDHALERAGVPAYFDRGAGRPHPAGRAFLAILSCAVERLSARRFAEYLSLAQVPQVSSVPGTPPEADWLPPDDEVLAATAGISAEPPAPSALAPKAPNALAPNAPNAPSAPSVLTDGGDEEDAVTDGTLRAPWKWERLIVESSVIGGDPDRWRRRLRGLAHEFDVRIREVQREDPESPKLGRLRRDRRNLDHLRRFAVPIVEELAAWPASASWGDWLQRFDALAPRVLRHPVRVREVLAGLRPMAAIGPVRLEEARDVLSEHLLALDRDPPARRYGRVFVGGPEAARGRLFRVVFAPGLAERMFPLRPREDPLLLDAARDRLAADLTDQQARGRAERLALYLVAGAAAERLYLSYPSLQTSDARPRVASFYALDVARATTGRIPAHDDLARQAKGLGQASLAWPAPANPADAVDDFEHDLAVVRTLLDKLSSEGERAVRGRAHYLLRLNASLQRSVRVRWSRSRQKWSEHDGIVRATEITRQRLATQRLSARPYSVSALQKFAVCPYQFVLSAIHRLEPAPEPEPLQRLDPLTRGSLFHEVQALFFRRLDQERRLPVDAAGLDHAIDVLDAVLEKVAGAYRDELAPAIERVWRNEVEDIGRDLRVWARKLPDSAEWEPARFELSFGLVDDPHAEGRDARSVREPARIDGRFLLRGSVDLVERKAGTQLLRVTDHKTGRKRVGDRAVVDGGRALQPVLYGLAVEQVMEAEVSSGRLYYCTAAGGFDSHEIPLNDRNRRLGLEALEIVDRAIELGHLPPAPASRACEWCDFRPVCGPDEERRAKHKSPDLLMDLQALREMP